MKRWLQIALLIGSGLCSMPVRALDQFLLVDVTYTATTQNTSDSHYRVEPKPGTPTNWRNPVDYTGGKAYVHLDVLEKPGSAKTIYNVCFDGASNSTCMGYPPAYTAAGSYDFSFALNTFWQFDVYDWTKGVKQVALILKDENGDKVQGDSKFYPTKVHVTITIVPSGEMYQPNPVAMDAGQAEDAGSPPRDAGTTDAGNPSARDASTGGDAGSARDAGRVPASRDAGQAAGSQAPEVDGGAAPRDAGTSSAGASAGLAGTGSTLPPAAGSGGSTQSMQRDQDAGTAADSGGDSGCAVLQPGSDRGWPALLAWVGLGPLGWFARRRLQRPRRR